MGLHHIVYASRPFGFSASDLMGILMVARANNLRDGITGALVCRDDLFLQYLEGEEAVVSRCFRRIRQDDRHVEVTELVNGPAAERMFPHWAMRHDPEQSWVWSRKEVAAGVPASVPQEEVLAMFRALAASPAAAD
jgi:hypothetical protein